MAFRSASSSNGNTNSGTIPVPAGAQTNDIAILWLAVDSGTVQTVSWPAGFTELFSTSIATPDGQAFAASWKRLTGADSGTYSFSWTSGADSVRGCAMFSGRDTTNPPVNSTVATSTASNPSPITITANGVTAVAGDDLAWIAAPDIVTANNGTSFTPPSSYTEQLDLVNQPAGGFSNTSLATLDAASAGATGSVSGTFTATANAGWLTTLIRIPASGGAAATPSGSSDYYAAKAVQQGVINGAQPHLLAYESYPPRGLVPSPVVPYGKTDYYDARLFSRTLNRAMPQWQQHDAYAMRFVQQNPPPGSGGFSWYYDSRLNDLLRLPKPKTFQMPYDGFQPRGQIDSITKQGMSWYYDARLQSARRGPRPELLTHDAQVTRSFVVVATPQGASGFYDFDKYPALQFRHQHEGYPAQGLVPTAATPQGWTTFYDVEAAQRSKAALADHESAEFTFYPSRPLWTDYYDAEVIKPRARDYTDAPSSPAQAVTVTGWGSFFDRSQVRPNLTQQHETYPALGLVPTAATPQGWWLPLDLARVRPVSPAQQQFDGYQHFFPPAAVNLGPLGWSMYWDKGRRPLSADRMPFLFEQLYQTPTAATPQGWTHLLDVARVKGFPAHLQQHDALGRMSFPRPFVGVTFERLDAFIIRPRPFPYSVVDTPPFRAPQGWEPSYALAVRRPFRFPDHAPSLVLQPAAAVPPSAYVLFPELFKRPRPFPYLTWPEQRVAVLNTPAGSGGPTFFYDRRLFVAHRPVAEVVPFDGRGLPFVVVTLIVHQPRESGLLTAVALAATSAGPTLSGLNAPPTLGGLQGPPSLSGSESDPSLSGEVEN